MDHYKASSLKMVARYGISIVLFKRLCTGNSGICGISIWNLLSTNIVKMVIFSLQPQNRKLPCCMYLAALAVTDNLFLITCFELTIMMGFFPAIFQRFSL